MKIIFLKIKNRLINLYQDYKYEAMIFKQTEIYPASWEKKLAWFLLFAILLLFIIPSNLKGLYYILYSILVCFLFIKKSRRDVTNIKTYFVKRKQLSRNNPQLIQRRFVFTSFTVFKTMKPVLAYCVICVSGFSAISAGVHHTHQYYWPGQKSPTVFIGEKITEYTGYPPESWAIKKNETDVLQEQLNNKDDIIKELTKKLENNKK